MSMADEEVKVVLGASIEGAIAGIKAVKEAVEGLTGPLKELQKNFNDIREALVAAFAIEKVNEFFNSLAEGATRLSNLHEITGTSTADLEQLKIMAKLAGVSFDSLVQITGRFELGLARAKEGIGNTGAGLKALGLSAQELIGKQLPDQLKLIADRFSELAPSTNREQIAMAIFGRGAQEIIPILANFNEELNLSKEILERTGAHMTDSQVDAFERLHKVSTELDSALKGLGNYVGEIFAPIWESIKRAITDVVESMTASIREGGALKIAFDGLALVIKVLVAALEAAITVFRSLWEAGRTAANIIIVSFETVGKVHLEIFSAIAKAGPAAFEAIWVAAKSAGDKIIQEFLAVGQVIAGALHFDGTAVSAGWDKMKQSASDAGHAFDGVSEKLSKAFDISGAVKAWHEGNAEIDQIAKDSVKNEIQIWKEGDNQITTMFQQGSAKREDDAKKEAQAINLAKNKGHSDAIDAAIKEIDGEIKALQAGLALKKEILKQEAAEHLITKQQEFAALEKYTDQEYEAEKALLQKELALDGLKLSQKQELLNKLKALEDKHRLEMVKLDGEAVADMQKQYESFFSTIGSAFTSQLGGLLKGTTSWRQAMGSIFLSLTESVIGYFVKQTEAYIAGQLAQTTAATTGAAARAAAETAGAEAGLAPVLAGMVKSIMGSAATTFAGIFGFLSPVMGPAAVGPAAAGEATVAAAASGIGFVGGGLAVGAWNLDRDVMSVLHQGEMVVPATFASGIRNAMSGGSGPSSGQGGVNITFTVQAIDAAGVQAFFTKNAATVAKTISKQLSLNPSNRPAYG
jgi:hypothetical protein